MKTFTVAGTSVLNGVTKLRVANDPMRVKVLAKNGHTDILLIELPEAMTKVEAAKFIMTIPEFEGVEDQTAIADYLSKHDTSSAIKAPVTAPVEAEVTEPVVDDNDAEYELAEAEMEAADEEFDFSYPDGVPF